MSGIDRRLYLSSTVLDQDFLDWCADNLENRLEMICDIVLPNGDIMRVSDRNKYYGSNFYEARAVFPIINRTVGEWLSPDLQFSTFTIEVSNADSRYNAYLPGGEHFGSWIGNQVTVKIGLGESTSTYFTVFSGKVTETGGMSRSVKSITVTARDDYDLLNVDFPKTVFKYADFPKIQDDVAGVTKPIIYGDYTTSTEPSPAIVPAFIVNGANPQLDLKSRDISSVTATSPGVFTSKRHLLDIGDKIQFETTDTLPTPLVDSTDYWVVSVTENDFLVSTSFGGSPLNLTDVGVGDHSFICVENVPIQCVVAENDLISLNEVWIERQGEYHLVPSSYVTIGSGNKSFTLNQDISATWFEGGAYQYTQTDKIYVKCKGKNLGANTDNLVAQAKDILQTFTSFTGFNANWSTFITSMSSVKSRVWVNSPRSSIQYALSLLEQVKLEAYIDKDGTLKINSLNFSDWEATPDYTIYNWDIVKNTFKPQIDERNNFNRAKASFDFHPDKEELAKETKVFKNQASIDQVGKTISKKIEFPNLYVLSDVEYYLQEILKLSSAIIENIDVSLTWRSILQDIGSFVSLNVDIGSAVYEDVPCMIRSIGYDPVGLKLIVEMWSFPMCPYPDYVPGYPGTVGGYNATITEE
jgi:hypothetical protein